MSWEELKNTTDWMSVCRFILSLLIVAVFSAVVFTVLFTTAAKMGEAALMLVGVLCSSFAAVVNYYIGSSSGSAVKDKLLKGAGNGR